MTILAIAVFWSYCGLLSLVAREDREWPRNPLVQMAGTAGFLGLLSWTTFAVAIPRGSPHEAYFRVPAFALVTIIGVGIGLRWWTFLVGHLFTRARAALLSEDGMKVEKTFDRARKAEHEGSLEEAARLYAEEAAADPGNPEPLRLLAEVLIRQGREEEAFARFRAALPLVASPEGRSTLAFRISDLLVRAGRAGEARGVLESVERDFPGTRYAEYARLRLGELR